MKRREAIKLIATAGAAASTAACTRTTEKAPPNVAVNPVLRVDKLKIGEPWPTPDPFLFCVHHDDAYPQGNEQLGPAASLAGRNLGQDFAGVDGWRMYHGQAVPGFPQHPHRGFETVTVVRRGLVDHSDSLGAAARYGEGDVQWLTAGRGILHSEMFPLLRRAEPNPLELFQIWMNLPKADKMAPPHFSMLWANKVPRQVTKDEQGRATELTIVAGRLNDLQPGSPPPKSWASRPDSDVAIWTLKLEPGANWTLPAARAGTNRTLYFFRGSAVTVAGKKFEGARAITLRPEVPAAIEAGPAPVELLLLQGRPINEPVVQYGPFVMNTREEIQQTFAEFRQTQFGGWPWASNDPVHGRDPGRFARHADGREERPS